MTSPRSALPSAVARALVALIAALVVAACGTPAAATLAPTAVPTASLMVAATTAPTIAPTPTIEITPNASPGVGTKITVGDQQYVTVTAFEPWAGTDQVKPATGNVFVTPNIRIDAIKTTSFDSADFSLRDATGKTYQVRTGRAPHLASLNGLEPQHYYAGYVTFEIPAAAALDHLTLVYAPSFLTTTYEISLQ